MKATTVYINHTWHVVQHEWSTLSQTLRGLSDNYSIIKTLTLVEYTMNCVLLEYGNPTLTNHTLNCSTLLYYNQAEIDMVSHVTRLEWECDVLCETFNVDDNRLQIKDNTTTIFSVFSRPCNCIAKMAKSIATCTEIFWKSSCENRHFRPQQSQKRTMKSLEYWGGCVPPSVCLLYLCTALQCSIGLVVVKNSAGHLSVFMNEWMNVHD